MRKVPYLIPEVELEQQEGAVEQLAEPGDEVFKHLQDAPPSVGAGQEVELEQQRTAAEEQQSLARGIQRDSTEVANQLAGPEEVVFTHVQDAPPLVGASTGTESSITISSPELITSPEVELPLGDASTPRRDGTVPRRPEDQN